MGCALKVKIQGKEVIQVTGNSCKNGELYGRKECTNPTRIVTSTVKVQGSTNRVVSVKTEKDISKEQVFAVIKLLKELNLEAPVKMGDIIAENIFDTGINIIATSNAAKAI
jgi:CxxC motif-containing protein